VNALAGTGSDPGSIILAAALIATIPVLTGRLDFAKRSGNPFLDITAGIAVAYVFVDILPHLAASQNKMEVPAIRRIAPDALVIYLIVLGGFCFYLAAELALTESRKTTAGHNPSLRGAPWLASIMAGSIWVYGIFVGYSFTEYAEVSYEPIFLSAGAIAAHMIGLHHVFWSKNPGMYTTQFRLLYSAGPLLGCFLGLTTDIPDALFACGFAWLAGGLISSAMSQELPRVKNRRQLAYFLLGVLVFTVLIVQSEWFLTAQSHQDSPQPVISAAGDSR